MVGGIAVGSRIAAPCHARLFDKSVNMVDSHASPMPTDAERWARLTEKHRACLDLLLDHRTSKQIARILGIAKPTVDQRIAAARCHSRRKQSRRRRIALRPAQSDI